MTTSLRLSLTFAPDPNNPDGRGGPCPLEQRLALAEAARRVLAVRPCPVSPDLAVRLEAVAKYRWAAS